ncbi:MAG TPA: xanthine dehydrogenase family protein subunit M [Desulfobacterales bacterium]|nr:xanthine dehydrogenase family protein subunit M [Desulfobacterales bacterium]
MGLPKFEYIAPETTQEACKILEKLGQQAKVMAGGTDLLIKMKHGLLRPRTIVGLRKIKELRKISFSKTQGLFIGAMALLGEVASHPKVKKIYPAVAYAASQTATVQIRNMGTVVGNICNAAPSADNIPCLMALGAELIVVSPQGERRVLLEDFFKGPGEVDLIRGELVKGVVVPPPPKGSGLSYQFISQRSKVDIAAVCVAAMVVVDKERAEDVRIVLGAVAPKPIRSLKAEDLIRGKKLSDRAIQKASEEASQECRPISDMRATAEYRRAMVAVLTKRALMEARQMALSS